MKTNVKKLVCFDNEGESFDRFTILNTKTGDLIGASEHPYNPLGFGQYAGNVADNYWNIAYGYSWRQNVNVKNAVKFAVNHFLNDCSHIGKVIAFDDLPDEVKKFAVYYFSE